MTPGLDAPDPYWDRCGDCDEFLFECRCDDPGSGTCPDCGRPRDYCCDDGPGYECDSCEGIVHYAEDGPLTGRGHLPGCPLIKDPEP